MISNYVIVSYCIVRLTNQGKNWRCELLGKIDWVTYFNTLGKPLNKKPASACVVMPLVALTKQYDSSLLKNKIKRIGAVMSLLPTAIPADFSISFPLIR